MTPAAGPGNKERRRGRVRRDTIRGNYRYGPSMGYWVTCLRIDYVVKSRAIAVVKSFVVAGSKRRFSTLKLDDTEQADFAWMLNSDLPAPLVLSSSGSPDDPEIAAGIYQSVLDSAFEQQANNRIDRSTFCDSAQIEHESS